jgi:hypothetical protein
LITPHFICHLTAIGIRFLTGFAKHWATLSLC